MDTSVKAHVSASAPAPKRLSDEDAEELKSMIEAHVARTGSRRGTELLTDWDEAVKAFWVVRPEPPRDDTNKPVHSSQTTVHDPVSLQD